MSSLSHCLYPTNVEIERSSSVNQNNCGNLSQRKYSINSPSKAKINLRSSIKASNFSRFKFPKLESHNERASELNLPRFGLDDVNSLQNSEISNILKNANSTPEFVQIKSTLSPKKVISKPQEQQTYDWREEKMRELALLDASRKNHQLRFQNKDLSMERLKHTLVMVSKIMNNLEKNENVITTNSKKIKNNLLYCVNKNDNAVINYSKAWVGIGKLNLKSHESLKLLENKMHKNNYDSICKGYLSA